MRDTVVLDHAAGGGSHLASPAVQHSRGPKAVSRSQEFDQLYEESACRICVRRRTAVSQSLYQPTHGRHPENQQDPIRFRDLVKELAESLLQRYAAAETRLLEPFEAIAKDAEFWNHTLDGLAVLGGPGIFQALRIAHPVGELVVVADSSHTDALPAPVKSESTKIDPPNHELLIILPKA